MTQLTNEANCILSQSCKLSKSEKCTPRCPSFVQLHGLSGTGGRAGASQVPKEYRLLTVQTSPVRDEQAEVYKRIDAYTSTFKRQFEPSESKRIRSLYLFSESPGNGKTTTAISVLNQYLITHYIGSVKRGQAPVQRPVYFLDVNEWQTLFNKANRQGAPRDVKETAAREYYKRMDAAQSTPFVVLDDIGVRSATEAFRGDLHSIINSRVTNGLPTVYTSNIPIDNLAQVFDERLYDRIRDLCVVISFQGGSKRGIR